MNLNEQGACRCLLRIRQNEGRPSISDAAFIARFVSRCPEWRERPGAADTAVLGEIARALGVAEHIEIVSDYDRVLTEHRRPEHSRLNQKAAGAGGFGFECAQLCDAACPNGSGVLHIVVPLPERPFGEPASAARPWWDRWGATGMVLHPAQPGLVEYAAV